MFARFGSLAMLLSVILVVPATAYAHGTGIGSKYVVVNLPDAAYPCIQNPFHSCHLSVHAGQAQVLVGPAQLPRSATREAVQQQCPGRILGAVCGTVNVPLDRQNPQNGEIAIFF